jgi:hypothetical protein
LAFSRTLFQAVFRDRSAKRKQVPLILYFAEPLLVPGTIVEKSIVKLGVQRDRPALACFGLRSSYAEELGLEVDLRPSESLDLVVSQGSVSSQDKCCKNVRTFRLHGLSTKALCLCIVEGLADPVLNRQFELLTLPESCPDDFTRVAEHLQQKAHLFIDRFRRSALAEAALLVVNDTGFIDVHDELSA